jgi:hypothetical protein
MRLGGSSDPLRSRKIIPKCIGAAYRRLRAQGEAAERRSIALERGMKLRCERRFTGINGTVPRHHGRSGRRALSSNWSGLGPRYRGLRSVATNSAEAPNRVPINELRAGIAYKFGGHSDNTNFLSPIVSY